MLEERALNISLSIYRPDQYFSFFSHQLLCNCLYVDSVQHQLYESCVITVEIDFTFYPVYTLLHWFVHTAVRKGFNQCL